MNKVKSNRMNSFLATEEVMLRYEETWKASANVTNQFTLIRAKLPLVNHYHQKQNNKTKPSTVVKSQLKVQLMEKAVKIAVSAVDYAAGIKDLALETTVSITYTSLRHLKEVSLLDTLVKFYGIVKPLKDQLKHLNPSDMDDFGAMLDEFKKAIPKPQADSDESKTATQTMGSLIYEIADMFRTLDKFVAPFAYTAPDFYNDYKNSRVIKDLRRKGNIKSGETAAA